VKKHFAIPETRARTPEPEFRGFLCGTLPIIRNMTAGNGWFASTKFKDPNGFTPFSVGPFG
jgi:hypothetical protein